MTNVYMDPAELRRIAERLLGDREYDYRVQLSEIHEDLRVGNASRFVNGAPNEGYVYGRSGIGAYHDECVEDNVIMFENIDQGLIALANVYAAISEDYTDTDGEAGLELESTMDYFTPGGAVPR
ncbi:hypothetical protein [Phytomonospora endophytica]|uniref:Uncharacterized protein n=1 Tax=Phytomonospora endophytica TaxID=714109 RepID=A0A841FXL0_9ACTN|nr:hypothetical protein [Phytomonospora endophytica]MBB6038272.1 hypothetical protein [Phytomonospora endophytica]GIG64201.1 hypothetical protein Pen01_04960 [Phytomonospora endophytica]